MQEYVVDPATGEIVGVSNKEEWVVETPEAADELLEMIAEHDAEILKLQSRLWAVMGNLQSMQHDHMRRRNWLIARFRDSLEIIARLQIGNSKTKTAKFEHGKLQFRMSRGSIKVRGTNEAIAWLENLDLEANPWAAEAVAYDPRIRVGQLKGHEEDLPNCFEVEWPREEFIINTGIKLPKPARVTEYDDDDDDEPEEEE